MTLYGMSLWEFQACVEGYIAANTTDPMPVPPSEAEYHDMVARLLN